MVTIRPNALIAAGATELLISGYKIDLLQKGFCTRYCRPSAFAFAADMYTVFDALLFHREDTIPDADALAEQLTVPRIGTALGMALLNNLHTVF
jgi:hypothetical protein